MGNITRKPREQDSANIEAMLRKWFQSYSDKDFDTHNAMIHPDVVVVYPEMCHMNPDNSAGIDFLLKTLEEDEQAFVNLRQDIDRISVVDDTAFVEGRFIGDEFGGTIEGQANGSDIKLRFIHKIRVQDEKIREVHSYYDTALLYQIQLGLEGPTKDNPVSPWMIEMGKKRAEAEAAK